MITHGSSNDFKKFMDFISLLSDAKSFRASMNEYKKAIDDLEKASEQYKDALAIAPTVEAANALLADARIEKERLAELSDTLEASRSTITKEVISEANAQMLKTRVAIKELEKGLQDFAAYQVTENTALANRERVVEEREAELVKQQNVFKSEFLSLEAKKKKLAEAIGG